jgi:hypothetical protein
MPHCEASKVFRRATNVRPERELPRETQIVFHRRRKCHDGVCVATAPAGTANGNRFHTKRARVNRFTHTTPHAFDSRQRFREFWRIEIKQQLIPTREIPARHNSTLPVALNALLHESNEVATR